MTNRSATETGAGVLAGFTSSAHLVRFCLAVTFVLALVALTVWLLVSHLAPGQRLSIAFNKEGSTIISVNNEPSKALVLIPAGHLWTNTGLKLATNQRITIGATGLVNLAIHRLVDAANADVRPRHGWVGPEGGFPKNEKPLDRLRKPLLIEPRVGYGCLLAYVRPEGEPDPGTENPRPMGIQVVGRYGELTYLNPSGREGTLFLTVNDTVIRNDDASEKAYMANQQAIDETYGPNKVTVATLRDRWRNLVKENYWEVWYDDNVGEFLVQISYESKS